MLNQTKACCKLIYNSADPILKMMPNNNFGTPSGFVQLYFSARELRNRDSFSKSDPFLTLQMQKSFYGNMQPIGRTQTISNTDFPEWQQKLVVPYYFQSNQPMIIEVYDQDGSSNSDFIGRAQTTLGKIMGIHLQVLVLDLIGHNGNPTGKLTIRAQKVQQSSFTLKMKWRGEKIANVDKAFFGKSDPYLKFLKVRQDTSLIEVGRTQVKMNDSNPSWQPVSLPADKLLGNMNNPNASFRVECCDFQQGTKHHKPIGVCTVSANELRNGHPPLMYNLFSNNTNKAGTLYLQRYQMSESPAFVDYLKSGLQLNLVAAIDFTGSNGDPKKNVNSLHYIVKQPTQYQLVLKSIWDIIQNYDSDKKIPTFGFGAIPRFQRINKNQVDHCFPVNDNPTNPDIQGFQNVMNAYVNAVNNMSFDGPTYFTPLLKEAFRNAEKLVGSYSYQILLILTDGEIHDMDATIDIIIKNANLPMSIIIVGIGNENFQNMIRLDGDGGLANSKGNIKCPRDIVQFVPFNKFQGNAQNLAAEILREIPSHVTQYFTMMGKMPQIPQVGHGQQGQQMGMIQKKIVPQLFNFF